MKLLFGVASAARTEHSASAQDMGIEAWDRYLESVNRAHPPGGVAEAWIIFPEDDQPSEETCRNLGVVLQKLRNRDEHFDVRIIGLNSLNQTAVEHGFKFPPSTQEAS